MQYLVRFVQQYETFRRPELESLGALANIPYEIVFYSTESPFCVIEFGAGHGREQTARMARDLIARSILAKGIYELWGEGMSYEALHVDVRRRSEGLWAAYERGTFKFSLDTYLGKRSEAVQREIINSFSYLGFKGKVVMRKPDHEFVIFEEWDGSSSDEKGEINDREERREFGETEVRRKCPKKLFLGRSVGGTKRTLSDKHDLKKRPYISTTSMDAELALVTANMALAAPGKLFLDPFVGTGGFMVAAAELGAVVFGSDIDGRSFRGKGVGLEKGVGANFRKYGLESRFGDCVVSDLTNTPFRDVVSRPPVGEQRRWLDGIICDPPYGVREGLKVLGARKSGSPTTTDPASVTKVSTTESPYLIDGIPAWTLPDYVAPKKPYSFTRMLNDILDFAGRTVVDGGRLAFWMPSANETEEDFPTPVHHLLVLKHVCIQSFSKWSRKLLVYERVHGDVPNGSHIDVNLSNLTHPSSMAGTADDLNHFRRKYFQGFVEPQ